MCVRLPIKVIDPTARDIEQATSSRALNRASQVGESCGLEVHTGNTGKWNSPIFSTFLYVGYSMLFVC